MCIIGTGKGHPVVYTVHIRKVEFRSYLYMFFTPNGFLKIGGAVLLLVAILGFVGVIGPTEDSLFGAAWYFDNGENWAHLILGVVGLIAAFTLGAGMQKTLVMILGIVGVLVGLYSLFSSIPTGANLLGAQLQNPADSLLHLLVGAWALFASMRKPAMVAAAPSMPQ